MITFAVKKGVVTLKMTTATAKDLVHDIESSDCEGMRCLDDPDWEALQELDQQIRAKEQSNG